MAQIGHLKKLAETLKALNLEVLLLSADSPTRNAKFRKKQDIPFLLLSDEEATTAVQYQIPLSTKHPAAKNYKNGFIQPAVFVYKGDEEIFQFIQMPKMMNLWGASGRPHPGKILEMIQSKWEEK